MKKCYRMIKLTKNKAEIEISSLQQFLRIPLEIFNNFAKKKVKISIEVKE